MESTASCKDCNLRSRIQDFRSRVEVRRIGQHSAFRFRTGSVMRDVALRTLTFLNFHFLEVDGESDVTYGAIRESDAHSEIHDVFDMSRSHNALIAGRDVHVETIQSDILLGVGPDQIVKLQSGERQNGLAIHLGVV